MVSDVFNLHPYTLAARLAAKGEAAGGDALAAASVVCSMSAAASSSAAAAAAAAYLFERLSIDSTRASVNTPTTPTTKLHKEDINDDWELIPPPKQQSASGSSSGGAFAGVKNSGGVVWLASRPALCGEWMQTETGAVSVKCGGAWDAAEWCVPGPAPALQLWGSDVQPALVIGRHYITKRDSAPVQYNGIM